ncbi:NADP-dependent L-serine/L-allo-threonine dehydrogenase ydfG [Aureobasidium pullulans]|nr:NADP-dependent L-serine/L-allo-threonine dehydrogenase ydfG [Aureobasidium pullulans]
MDMRNQNVLLTGASMGIGEAIANSLAREGANLILLSRSEDKLFKIAAKLNSAHTGAKCIYRTADISDYESVDEAVKSATEELGSVDILINNAGLALGAPNAFPDLNIKDILTMNNTNVNGLMLTTYAVLQHGMRKRGAGTILNVTSVTGLEIPPFAGEAVYHANKACQEGFTNALRSELVGTNIRVLALRPGCVATNFHSQRVGHDKQMYEEFFDGYTGSPLEAKDIADAAIYMLKQPEHISVKAMDVVPTAQRSLATFDREWDQRNNNTTS